MNDAGSVSSAGESSDWVSSGFLGGAASFLSASVGAYERVQDVRDRRRDNTSASTGVHAQAQQGIQPTGIPVGGASNSLVQNWAMVLLVVVVLVALIVSLRFV